MALDPSTAYSRAIELNPRNAIAHSWFAYLCAKFDADETIALSARAMELEPFAPYIAATAGSSGATTSKFASPLREPSRFANSTPRRSRRRSGAIAR